MVVKSAELGVCTSSSFERIKTHTKVSELHRIAVIWHVCNIFYFIRYVLLISFVVYVVYTVAHMLLNYDVFAM